MQSNAEKKNSLRISATLRVSALNLRRPRANRDIAVCRKGRGSEYSNSPPFSDRPSADRAWSASASIASLRSNGAPRDCTDPGTACRDKGAEWKSCNKLIVFAIDASLPRPNLHLSRFALWRQTERARTLEVKTSRVMKSSADSGGGVDASGTVSDLSQTRQRKSTTSKERRYRLTQTSQHGMRGRSLL